MECYKQAVESDPSCVTAWGNMGTIHEQRNEIDLAIQCIRSALTAQPELECLHQGLARLLVKSGAKANASGATEQAIALYEEALMHHPAVSLHADDLLS